MCVYICVCEMGKVLGLHFLRETWSVVLLIQLIGKIIDFNIVTQFFSYIVNLDIRSLMINPYFQEPNDFKSFKVVILTDLFTTSYSHVEFRLHIIFPGMYSKRFISRISNTV